MDTRLAIHRSSTIWREAQTASRFSPEYFRDEFGIRVDASSITLACPLGRSDRQITVHLIALAIGEAEFLRVSDDVL